MHYSSVSSEPASRQEDGGSRWLVLIHQLPAEPAYLRVKVSRRLKGLGALALKNSVYLLPAREEAREDFAWLRKEITGGGGEATILSAGFVEGVSDAELEERFSAERDEEYGTLTAEVHAALESDEASASDLRRLRARLEAIMERDFFDAGGRFAAVQALAELERWSRGIPGVEEAAMRERPVGGTWVTRAGIKVDRLASAWLIRRHIDPQATFKYVAGAGSGARDGELRFDMYEGEFTHEGDRCTFETLVRVFGLSEPGLAEMAEIVHDLDFKDEKFGRPESAGVATLVKGIVSAHASDEARLEAAMPVLDALFASYRSISEPV